MGSFVEVVVEGRKDNVNSQASLAEKGDGLEVENGTHLAGKSHVNDVAAQDSQSRLLVKRTENFKIQILTSQS